MNMMAKRVIATVALMCALAGVVRGQQLDSADMALLRQAQQVDHTYDTRRVSYGFKPGRHTWNPFYHILSSGMYAYQSVVSPLLSTRCSFTPTCSAYSKLLIREYGLLKGTFLTADRLMRCNRIAMSDLNNKYILVDGHGVFREGVDRYRL